MLSDGLYCIVVEHLVHDGRDDTSHGEDSADNGAQLRDEVVERLQNGSREFPVVTEVFKGFPVITDGSKGFPAQLRDEVVERLRKRLRV